MICRSVFFVLDHFNMSGLFLETLHLCFVIVQQRSGWTQIYEGCHWDWYLKYKIMHFTCVVPRSVSTRILNPGHILSISCRIRQWAPFYGDGIHTEWPLRTKNVEVHNIKELAENTPAGEVKWSTFSDEKTTLLSLHLFKIFGEKYVIALHQPLSLSYYNREVLLFKKNLNLYYAQRVPKHGLSPDAHQYVWSHKDTL